jgi:Pyruvate/2-oxoacid:ferredoxin oxidoreductase gamma subunit
LEAPVAKVNITKKDFQKYVEVQMSGKTNMMAIGTVSALTGLSRDKVLNIMQNYSALDKKYSK